MSSNINSSMKSYTPLPTPPHHTDPSASHSLVFPYKLPQLNPQPLPLSPPPTSLCLLPLHSPLSPKSHNYPPPAPPDGSRFDPAQTPPMPVVPKHAQANTKPPPGVPAAMATAKHGSLTTPPSAHRVDTPCMPPAHSLRCPLPSAHNVTPSPSTSQISPTVKILNLFETDWKIKVLISL